MTQKQYIGLIAYKPKTSNRKWEITVFERNRKREGKLSGFDSSLVVQLLDRRTMFIDKISAAPNWHRRYNHEGEQTLESKKNLQVTVFR